jgi:MscS family membrane protein
MPQIFLRGLPILLLLFWSAVAMATKDMNPLQPLDLSSPRATLDSFLTRMDAFYGLLEEEYWDAPSPETAERVSRLNTDIERMLDLSDIPPAARFDQGRDAIQYLYDVLCRIKLPPPSEIPDAVINNDAAEGSGADLRPRSWTIPHTEITLVQVTDGHQAGQYVFSSSTVARAQEFYDKTRGLPYRRDMPLPNYAEMRSYLSMSGWIISARTIEGLPGWLKRSAYGQAVWKWLALLVLLTITTVLIIMIHRLSRRRLSGDSSAARLRRLVTPLALLLVPAVLDMSNKQLTLTGQVTTSVELMAALITFFALAWLIWTGSMILAEMVIASPRISERSLNAHLLRLIARTAGVLGVIAIVIYVSNELGVPLYGIVAGLGVGGLAVALAVRPTLENIISGLILFTDKPVQIGDFCSFGNEMGTIEEIGLRSTRIRRRDDTLVSVPNADFVQRELHNYARRRTRLYETTLGLRYETTPEQLRYVLVRLREMLNRHPKVSPEKLHVRFHGFGAYSLDIALFAYIRTRDRLTYRAIREDINLRIIDIINEAGTGFAFPSQTTYLGRDTGLDSERGREAEMQVQEWRSAGQLPFPEFDKSVREAQKDVLDYPPKGSPDYKSAADSPGTAAKP